VEGLYGAIGQAPKKAMIYDGDNEQEAVAEMQKKQLEKLKKGYIIVGAVGTLSSTTAQKKNNLPTIWPMNAQGVRDDAHLQALLDDPSYIAQEKLDGMRAIVHVTKHGLRIFSRSAGVEDPTRPLENTSALLHLANLTFPYLTGTILDGEILAPGVDCASLSGTIHRKNGNGDNSAVHLYVFDVLRVGDQDLSDSPLSARLLHLAVLEPQLQSKYIHFLPWVATKAEKRKLFESVLARGGEGIMVKRVDAQYVQGGRPANNWYKAKKSYTFDCVVMGFTRGKGKYNSTIGAVVFGQYVYGKLAELGQASGMTDRVRKQMSSNPEAFIGQVVLIQGMERLKSGAIRHPRFVAMRSDKRREDCVWYQGEQ
jgi:ATP-dependent DNA ligase